MTKSERISLYFVFFLMFVCGMVSYSQKQDEKAKKFEHKYVAGDCIGFDLYDMDFERNSEGETLGEARIEFVRYDEYGAYYGVRLIEDRFGDKPTFKYPKTKNPIGKIWASEIDHARIVQPFSFTDYVPGSKVITIRNGMTCRHGWKDE